MGVDWTHAAQELDGDRVTSPELESTGSAHKMNVKDNMEEDDGGEAGVAEKTWGEALNRIRW